MQDAKSQLVGRLKDTTTVLVSVSNNPSVDQLAATLAITLMLNKLGKHATAVFSGDVPSLMDFLHPEKTFKKNTDSLRDFIISLDKEKADKLRYKLENEFVKIFITPYNTTLTQKDLVFSQGEVNVEVVLALGVHTREELDRAIVANGRILHDATVATINTKPISNLGSINWASERASSLCEMLCELAEVLGPPNLIDSQIANALLTGLVAETQRFSNEKTTSVTMSAGSKLLALGANQQLVSNQLAPIKPPKKEEEKPLPPKAPSPPPPPPTPEKSQASPVEIQKAASTHHEESSGGGDLKIDHIEEEGENDAQDEEAINIAQVSIDDQGNIKPGDDKTAPDQAPSSQPAPPPVSDHPFANRQLEPTPPAAPTGAGYLISSPSDNTVSDDLPNTTTPNSTSLQTDVPESEVLPEVGPVRGTMEEELKSSTTPSSSQFVSVGQDGVKEDNSSDEDEDGNSTDSPSGGPPPFPPPITSPPPAL